SRPKRLSAPQPQQPEHAGGEQRQRAPRLDQSTPLSHGPVIGRALEQLASAHEPPVLTRCVPRKFLSCESSTHGRIASWSAEVTLRVSVRERSFTPPCRSSRQEGRKRDSIPFAAGEK